MDEREHAQQTRGEDMKRALNPEGGIRSPLIPSMPTKDGTKGYIFPTGGPSGFAEMQDFFYAPELVKIRTPSGWGDSYTTLLQNFKKNSKWLDTEKDYGTENVPKSARELFKKKPGKGRVAVITSCGPSLTNNFTHIFEAKDQGCPIDVFGLNRSIRAIIPDYQMIIERRGDDEWIDGKLGFAPKMISVTNACHETIQAYLDAGSEVYWGKCCMATKEELESTLGQSLPEMSIKGGSTLSCVIYTAFMMGYETILLTGCDFALESKLDEKNNLIPFRVYFDRTYERSNYNQRPNYALAQLFVIQGIDGKPWIINRELYHLAGFMFVMDRFARDNFGGKLINCTEGGVLNLEETRPLEQALAMYAGYEIGKVEKNREIYNHVWVFESYSKWSPGDRRFESVMQMLHNDKLDTLLDWGCGSGPLAVRVAQHAPTVSVYAWDLSDVAVLLAKARARRAGELKNIMIARSPAALEIPKEARLMVTCFDVLEHLADRRTVIDLFKELVSYNPLVIAGTAAAGKSTFRASSIGVDNLHPCNLRPFEWEEFLRNIAKELGYDVPEMRIDGRTTSFVFAKLKELSDGSDQDNVQYSITEGERRRL